MSTRTENPDTRTKSVDLPPYGPSNPDPITDAPGSHPIETGIGAALVGAAGGVAAGALGGPVGAVIGGIIGGAVAGGYAGKGVGELIDPTTEDDRIREYLLHRTENPFDRKPEDYREAYRYGTLAGERYSGRSFDEIDSQLSLDWPGARGASPLDWHEARDAARYAYGRTTSHRPRVEPPPLPARNSNVQQTV